MFDSHIHSNFSADSKLVPEDAVKIAIDKKLVGIAFTEHVDYEMPGYEDFYICDFDKYFNDILKIKNKYKDNLKIVTGIEIGQTPTTFNKNSELLNNYNFDYVLSSVHVVNGIDVYDKSYYEGKSKIKAYELYLEAIYTTINDFLNYDMIAHFDYLTRKAPYKDKQMKYRDLSDHFDEIFKKLISIGKGFEINTGIDMYVSQGEIIDINILKRYKEMGGEKICLGSDAHDKKRIASNFEYCLYLLKETGFNYLTYFEHRLPNYIKL